MRRAAAFLALALVALASVAAWRRGVFPARRSAGRVVFLGLDGADWQILDELIRKGAMPRLARVVAEGRAGILLTEHPPLSPLVWTTMMTGHGPLQHRILDFTRLHPGTLEREPITSDERRVPALWNMAAQRGRRSAVLGMWATYPAERVPGVVVSDRLFSFQAGAGGGPGIVWPAARAGWARSALEATDAETGFEAVRAMVPSLDRPEYDRLAGSPQAWSHPITALRRILVETGVYERLGLDVLREAPPDLTILYVQGTDAVGHVFAPFTPPRGAGVSAADAERYAAVPEAYFRRVDALVGAVQDAAARAGASLMIASDHGFRWKGDRPATSGMATATAGEWHRDEGLYVLWGPRVTAPAGGGRERGHVGQVCATVLALLGLPPGRGLAGPPLPGTPGPDAGTTAVDYDAGFRPADAAPAAADASEQIEKLRALGYIGPGDGPTAGTNEGPPAAPARGVEDATRTAASFNNEGLILAEQGQAAAARSAFERALARDPTLASARWNLSDLLWSNGEGERADALLVAALDGSPESLARLRARLRARQAAAGTEAAFALLGRAVAARPKDPALRLLRGRTELERSDCRSALADFEEAARGQPRDPIAQASAGLARLCLGDTAGARRAFVRSLALDPAQPEVRKYLEGTN